MLKKSENHAEEIDHIKSRGEYSLFLDMKWIIKFHLYLDLDMKRINLKSGEDFIDWQIKRFFHEYLAVLEVLSQNVCKEILHSIYTFPWFI